MSLSENNEVIIFRDVCKRYRLYETKWQMVQDAFSLGKKGIEDQAFYALKNLNLSIRKGDRIGLVGRNGAGKSTLLKLMTGNFAPTSGEVIINGKVQALMATGLGFHPEFTGLENIKASLLYNGLSKQKYNEVIEDIVDFVELGQFLNQPLKTYSLGMQSRLFFAVATAIEPEVLVIDEVLGAGDAYFSAKSAERMKRLTASGCTLVLVSHASQQILQFCDQAIWLESGEIVMQGASLEVVKAYEEYSKSLELASEKTMAETESAAALVHKDGVTQTPWLREKLLKQVLAGQPEHTIKTETASDVADEVVPTLETAPALMSSPLVAEGGVSRWVSHDKGLEISDITLLDDNQDVLAYVKTGDALNIQMTIVSTEEEMVEKTFDVYFMILLFTEDGRWLVRHCSDKYEVALKPGEEYAIKLRYDEVLLGTGKYVFSAGLYKVLDLHDLSTARYYDLLSRSFEFKVQNIYAIDETVFTHPSSWQPVELADKAEEKEVNEVA